MRQMFVFKRHRNTDGSFVFFVLPAAINKLWNFLFLAVAAVEKIDAQHEQGDRSSLEQRGDISERLKRDNA